MIHLAPYKYRNVFQEDGGPIGSLDYSSVRVLGEDMIQANAWLDDSVIPEKRDFEHEFPDGVGTHKSEMTARYMAVSEAIERWAIRCLTEDKGFSGYGFDVDRSSNGMAAFPGVFAYQAREKAEAEALERYCLFQWWEGKISSKMLPSFEDKNVFGIEIDNPYSRHKIALLWKFCDQKFHAIGFGIGNDLDDAIRRTSIELIRMEEILKRFFEKQDHYTREDIESMDDVLAARILYYAQGDGFEEFLDRINNAPAESLDLKKPKVVFNGVIPGPWSKYATVYRVVFDPPTTEHLSRRIDYFFW